MDKEWQQIELTMYKERYQKAIDALKLIASGDSEQVEWSIAEDVLKELGYEQE